MLYEEMYEAFPDVKNVREVTVEAGRPDTITPAKLEVLNKWNIDRISINPAVIPSRDTKSNWTSSYCRRNN